MPFINAIKSYLCAYKLAHFELHPLTEEALEFVQVSKQRPSGATFPAPTNAFTVSLWKFLLYLLGSTEPMIVTIFPQIYDIAKWLARPYAISVTHKYRGSPKPKPVAPHVLYRSWKLHCMGSAQVVSTLPKQKKLSMRWNWVWAF